ncbi:GNAT family N-acetyltransferase [Kovacikia minuta CCNUW1]|uniref:GNAT family N-acetyltransferase n=1 Tax=Kovacikia minuta TaxID=2931930 RepID=UPI001CC8F38A|nr:GNAT family N-acetyltransferase [Kovacikia minuta]UBF26163.1 GNAT family N-acetyltransferase [Kovacikia minuta CCNUW1]
MQFQRFDSVKEFWQCAQNYLLQYEAEHNALLGVLHTLLHYPERYPELPYLVLVQTNDQILAIAIRTPPNNLLLSHVQDLNALNLISQDLQHEQLPGVEGLVAETKTFAQIWQSLTRQSYQQGVESRIYQLTQVEPVTTVKGHLRLAIPGDRPLLLKWFAAFNAEIDLISDDEIERRVDVELKRQSTYLWEDSIPVSMVGGRQFSATAARIAPVYTPPEYRRKGYATAGVAALSQKLLEQGCDRCFLFTDLANSTSNAIYQKIGYRPVCDWHEYSFKPKEHP